MSTCTTWMASCSDYTAAWLLDCRQGQHGRHGFFQAANTAETVLRHGMPRTTRRVGRGTGDMECDDRFDTIGTVLTQGIAEICKAERPFTLGGGRRPPPCKCHRFALAPLIGPPSRTPRDPVSTPRRSQGLSPPGPPRTCASAATMAHKPLDLRSTSLGAGLAWLKN